MSDEELKRFMEYFKDNLPDPEHYPHKVIWLMKWYQSIVMRNRKVKGFKEEVITITDKIGKKTIVGHLKRISKSNCGKCTGILRMYIRYGELTKTVPKLKVFLEQRIAGQKEWAIFK